MAERSPLARLILPSLLWGGVLAVVVALVGGGIGWAVAGMPGLVGGVLGAAVAAAFLGLTTVSFLAAGRATRNDPNRPAFYGIVLGAWGIKLVVFFMLMYWLRTQAWMDPTVFIVSAMAAIVGSLIVDAVVTMRSRVPYASDVKLPGDGRNGRL